MTPNSGYTSFPFGNITLAAAAVHSGGQALQIGNFDDGPLASLSQTFAEVSGNTYSGQIWVYYPQTDAGAFLQVLVDGTTLVNLPGTNTGSYTEFTFSFIGTGSDTLTIQAQTDPGEWFVDDVSVQGDTNATVGAPGPIAGAGIPGVVLAVAGPLGWRRTRKSVAAILSAA